MSGPSPRRARARALPRPAATALALVVVAGLLVLALTDGSASSLGGIAPDDLTAASFADERCDDQVGAEGARLHESTPEGSYDAITLTGVDPACDGLPAQLTAYGSGGTALAAGTATAVTSTFQVALDAAVPSGSLAGVAMAIQGWGIPVVLAGGLFQADWVIYQESLTNYCAEVTVTTTSPVPVPWEVQLSLAAYPLTGTPTSVWHGDEVAWDDPVLVVAGKDHENPTVDAANPTWFRYCADRPPAPPPVAEVDWEITQLDEDPSGYCATVALSTTSPHPVTWLVEIDLSGPEFPYYPVVDPTSYTAAIDFDAAPLVVAMGDNGLDNDSIWAGPTPSGPRSFRFCVVADLPGTVELSELSYGSAWSAGYCIEFTLTTTSPTEIPWQVTFDLSNTLVPFVNSPSAYLPPGPPYDPLQVRFPPVAPNRISPHYASYTYAAPLLTVRGPGDGWGDKISAGAPVDRSFCVNS